MFFTLYIHRKFHEMKKLITLAALAVSAVASAQPVIGNGNNIPPVGYSDSIAVVGSGVTPGPGGVNVTWNFSTHTPTIGGWFTFVSPATTPYTQAFPSATHALQLSPMAGGSIYEYYVLSPAKWEVIGGSITGSSGDNYTANPKTMMPFPFSFSDVVTDTFTKQNGTHTVTMTYDGYGTLITPYATYNNVVRMKREFGGNDYFYDWFTTSPYLMTVATYDNNTGRLTFIGKSVINSIDDLSSDAPNVTVVPNPVSSVAAIRVQGGSAVNGRLIVTNAVGSIVREVAIRNNEAGFSREGLTSGVYFYSLCTEKGSVAKGRFVIE
jgi:hypothetical protein